MTPPRPAGLPRDARLRRPIDFDRVYAARHSAAAGALVLYAAPAPAGDLVAATVRLGLSVSRRVGGAVDRNRWKRRLREAYRAVRRALPPGNDYVVVVRPGSAAVPGGRPLEEALVELARRVTGRRGYGARATGGPGSGGTRRRR